MNKYRTYQKSPTAAESRPRRANISSNRGWATGLFDTDRHTH